MPYRHLLTPDTKLVENITPTIAPQASEWTDTAIEQHDLFNFEMKLDYLLNEELDENQFDIQVYFFFPLALNITPYSYPKEQFYADISDYLRFKTPRMSIQQLLDMNNRNSPVTEIKEMIPKLMQGQPSQSDINRAIYELKLTGAIVKASLRDQVQYFSEQICNKKSYEIFKPTIDDYLRDIYALLEFAKDIYRKSQYVQIPESIRESVSIVVDYICWQLETNLVKLYYRLCKISECEDLHFEMVKILKEKNQFIEAIGTKLNFSSRATQNNLKMMNNSQYPSNNMAKSETKSSAIATREIFTMKDDREFEKILLKQTEFSIINNKTIHNKALKGATTNDKELPLKSSSPSFLDSSPGSKLDSPYSSNLKIHSIKKNKEDQNPDESCIEISEKETSPLQPFPTTLHLNESFLYWEGIMKKFVQSMLYLSIEEKNEKKTFIEIFYSLAAGFAMFFSLALGLFVALQFEINSIPYISALVVIYILKDRIKDNIRAISTKFMKIILPDRVLNIYDSQNHVPIGEVKELAGFSDWEHVPSEILSIRLSQTRSSVEQEGKPETIFLYKKTITLDTKTIRDLHDRHGDISEILRFNVKKILQYADDPVQPVLRWNPETEKIEKQLLAKTYHLNVVLKVVIKEKDHTQRVEYKKVRVILDQMGIRRVEIPQIRF